jgi:hypothetical protein
MRGCRSATHLAGLIGSRTAISRLGSSSNGPQSRPVIGVAVVEPHRGAVPANDQPISVMLDFVNPIAAPEGGFNARHRLDGMTKPARRGLIFIAGGR